MIVNIHNLEKRVTLLNDWLFHHPDTHHLYREKAHKRNYYVQKLGEMDEYQLKTIEIQ